MKEHIVHPGSTISLKKIDPEATYPENLDRDDGEKEWNELKTQLTELQPLLYAERLHKVLIVLQATDTGGKDGAIRHVFSGVNPQGIRIASFKAPSQSELDRDYLWRIHAQVPARGEITVFNRSHYEDVLIVRVHNLVPKKVWSRRYDHINAFEQMLADEGVTILKFFLHISRNEQAKRLAERLADPEKHWKFNPGDLKERALWDDYAEAYEQMLEKTSTDCAPWFVIPSNRKWYRNLAITRVLVKTLQGLNMQYPKPDFDPSSVKIE